MTASAVENGLPANSAALRDVAAAVVRLARQHGFVRPRDVRAELARAGEPEGLWKETLGLARPSLCFRHGRYYYPGTVSAPARLLQDRQEHVRRAVRQMARCHRKAASRVERRGEYRIDFIQPVLVETDDGRRLTLLSRDLSASGIRLVGARSLLGQKVRVTVPAVDGVGPWCFVVRILWTCAVGDDLFENGGSLLDVGPAAGAD
ncbi:MAG TPA: PilZ domain-containing protein [Gemmataceae bacterium]|nr:PilZ domain-containing protein [Gemmataceae bacterium]